MARNAARWTCASLAVAALLSCADDAGPPPAAADPIAQHVERAVEIASAEWDAPWVLHHANSRYHRDGDRFVLDDHAYVFVSDDGAASHYLVRFHADGSVSSGPVAGRAFPPPREFDVGANAMTSVEAVDVAWEFVGAQLVDRCGPLRWLDVSGTISDEGRQWWAVEMSTGARDHVVWFDARTGAIDDVDEQPC